MNRGTISNEEKKKKNKKVSPVIKQETARFLRTTSMKGVPRIPKSEWPFLKAIWIIGVISLLAFSTFQVKEVVTNYLTFESFTATEEIAFHPRINKPPFPSLTVCNKKAVSSFASELQIDRYKSELQHCDLGHVHDYLCRRLLSNIGLFQYFGAEEIQKLGHSSEEFIINCQLLVLSGVWLDKVPCSNLVNITLLMTAKYFNCYRLDFPDRFFLAGGLMAGVSLVLHLDNHKSEERFRAVPTTGQYVDFIQDVQSMGAVLTAHHPSPDSYPFPSLDGIELSAGFSNKIHLEMRQRKRLKEPYGNCDEVESQTYGYLKKCLANCFLGHIQNNCNCTDIKWLDRVDQTPPEQFCETLLNRDLNDVKNKLICMNNTMNMDAFDKCIASCHPPCDENEYIHQATVTQWPNPIDLRKFHEIFIVNQSFEKKFAIVADAVACDRNRAKVCTEKQLQAKQLISENFLEVSYHLSDHRFLRLHEMPKTSLPDVCSKVGGILNLWSGLTVIVIIEFIELLFRVFKKSDLSFSPMTSSFRRLTQRRNNKRSPHYNAEQYETKFGAKFGFDISEDVPLKAV